MSVCASYILCVYIVKIYRFLNIILIIWLCVCVCVYTTIPKFGASIFFFFFYVLRDHCSIQYFNYKINKQQYESKAAAPPGRLDVYFLGQYLCLFCFLFFLLW